MMFETETAWLLEMRIQARGDPLRLAQIDQALWVLSRFPEAEDDAELDALEIAIEALAASLGEGRTRH